MKLTLPFVSSKANAKIGQKHEDSELMKQMNRRFNSRIIGR